MNEIVELDGHILSRIDAHFEEEEVVFDKLSLLEHFVRDETRETEAQRIGFARRPLEVLPRRVRNETLDDVARLVRIDRLVVQREADCVRKRPLEQSVVLARKDFDVNGHVTAFTRTVAVQK